jgi:(p)ppGpp synthase/HD superfamily hydrolase
VSDLAAALMVAIGVHAGQFDKQGEPYLLHVLRVVEAASPEAKVVAALHDVIEDGHLCLADVVGSVHLSMAEEATLDLLTRRDDQTYSEYIERMRIGASARIAREVKIADLRDNLGRIPPMPDGLVMQEAHNKWVREGWGSLQRRYTRALASLEAGGKT